MTFVKTVILHYPDFGGYLGVDGNEPVRIENGCAYEINPGKHTFRIYSDEAVAKSRKASPDIPEAAEGEEPTPPDFLDPWVFTETVTDSECLLITVESDGMKVVSAPAHQVFKISLASANKYLDTVKLKGSKPRYHVGLSITGIVLFFISIFAYIIGLFIYDPPFFTETAPAQAAAGAVLLSIVMMVAGFVWQKKKKKK